MINRLIEASAGTGKTEELARHLIALMDEGVRPEEIVALTFSRAAAGEIFERFVSILARENRTDALRRVIAAQHLSQIGTIDSFMIRLLKAYPLEAGLDGDLRLMDEFEKTSAQARVAFSVLRRTDRQTKERFVDAFSRALNHENVRSFIGRYRQFVGEWYGKFVAHPDEKAWGDDETIWKRSFIASRVTERELAEVADEIESYFAGKKEWVECAAWIRAYRGGALAKTGYAGKILEIEDLLRADSISFKYRKMIELSPEDSRVVIKAFAAVFGYAVHRQLELARGIYKMLTAYDSVYDKSVRSAGMLFFDDVPRLIAKLPLDIRASLEYRLDSRLRAWAIDEFQDTSREQWAVLENLVSEAKQNRGEKSVFLVGDCKQAIYGWREGDVDIFRREKRDPSYCSESRSETYRLCPTLVEAVNRVFARGRILTEFPDWECPEHRSASKVVNVSGFVRVSDAPGTKKDDFAEPVYEAIKAVIGTKISDPRRRSVEAAILVRGNELGELLADDLKSRGVEGVVWEGESAIYDTPALSPFLDLIELADHPGDLMTYRHFTLSELAKAMYPQGVPEVKDLSLSIARLCATRGLVRTLRELRAYLPAEAEQAWSRFTEERFTEMLRAAGEFERTAQPRVKMSDFISYLKAQSRRIVAEKGMIRIMTIHRSKGLGFDYVILPLYEPRGLNADRKEPLSGEDWLLPALDGQIARQLPVLKKAYLDRRQREIQEALCMYYVAMTRAKRGLSVVLHPEAKSKSAGAAIRFSELVRAAQMDDLVHPEVVLGVDDEGKRGATVDGEVRADLLPVPSRTPREIVRRRLPSLHFVSGMSAASLFSLKDRLREARARGIAEHARMEQVDFTDEMPKPEGFVELWREKSFEIKHKGEWISGRFDRVTFFETPSGLSAEIIDFKSSLENKERYNDQLETYRKALSVLSAIPIERISARLVKI